MFYAEPILLNINGRKKDILIRHKLFYKIFLILRSLILSLFSVSSIQFLQEPDQLFLASSVNNNHGNISELQTLISPNL